MQICVFDDTVLPPDGCSAELQQILSIVYFYYVYLQFSFSPDMFLHA